MLLVEDDARQRDSVTQLIGDDDVVITAVETGTEALALLGTTIFDCMIIDLKLPDIQGNELLRRMSTEDICSFPPVIVYTGRNSPARKKPTSQIFALHHHQSRTFARGCSTRSRCSCTRSNLNCLPRPDHAATSRSRDRVFEDARSLGGRRRT